MKRTIAGIQRELDAAIIERDRVLRDPALAAQIRQADEALSVASHNYREATAAVIAAEVKALVAAGLLPPDHDLTETPREAEHRAIRDAVARTAGLPEAGGVYKQLGTRYWNELNDIADAMVETAKNASPELKVARAWGAETWPVYKEADTARKRLGYARDAAVSRVTHLQQELERELQSMPQEPWPDAVKTRARSLLTAMANGKAEPLRPYPRAAPTPEKP